MIFRFYNESTSTVRLDLANSSGWQLGLGWSLGTADVDRQWLAQAPHPGAIPAGDRRPQVEMQIPLVMAKQANFTAVQNLMISLATELDRATNVIEFRPDGASASWFIDTYRSPIPSLFAGQQVPGLRWQTSPPPIECVIFRHPELRGASVYI